MATGDDNPFTARFAALPTTLAVFPLAGAVLLPRQVLPLNIFEPRYLALVGDALGRARMMGMVQPRGEMPDDGPVALHRVGCAGRITAFQESDDGRLLIQLTGVSRFEIVDELEERDGYRRFQVDWRRFSADAATPPEPGIGIDELEPMLRPYLDANELEVPWDRLGELSGAALIDFFAANLPLGVEEKQALLEAMDPLARQQVLRASVEMAVAAGGSAAPTRH